MFTGYTHVTIMCRNLETQSAFYRDVIGLPEMFRLPLEGIGAIVYHRLTETQFLELFSWGQGDQPTAINARGYHHFCLETPDIDAAVAGLKARGLRMSLWHTDGSGLYEVDHSAITTGLDGNLQSWFSDPEGNRIELMQITPDSLQKRALARLKGL